MKSKRLSPSLFSCVFLLKDGQFHSGNDLGSSLGISRAAISKIMNTLKSYQAEIEVSKTQGYRLKKPLILLDAEKIQAGLNTKMPVDIFEFVTSTNDYLLPLDISSAPRVCLAEYQTAGRGRFIRSWQATFGQSILLSYLYPCYEDVSTLSGFSLMIAVSLASVINRPDLKIKWPNDLYLGDKKLGGILIELRAQSHSETKVIIGIGINVMPPEDLKSSVASLVDLKNLKNLELDRNKLIISFLNQLEKDLILFKSKGLSAFLERFSELDYLKGREVTLTQHHEKHMGIAMGIDAQGALLIKKGEVIERYSAGDTSLAF